MMTTINGLTYTATRLTADTASDHRYSVRVTGPVARMAALDLGNLSWPNDTEIAKLCGEPVRFLDGGDDLAEAIYRSAGEQG